MKNKPFFPMFIDLSDKNIVVVGGGSIATRRVREEIQKALERVAQEDEEENDD